MVLEKTLQSALDNKEIKPVNPKEINPEYSLEGLMLKLKLQYYGHLMWRANALGKTLMLGKIEGRRRRGRQRKRWLDGITDSVDMSWGNSGRQRWQITLVCCSSWDHRVGHDLVTEQQQQQYYLREIALIFLLLQLPYHKTDGNNALWNTQMQIIPHKYKGLIFKGRGANMKRKMKTAAQRNTSL